MLNEEHETLKFKEIDSHKITMCKLERNIGDLSVQNKEILALRSKVRWLEAAVSDVKDRYDVCKKMSNVLDTNLRHLRRSLNMSR